jgi:hypothetical protein
LGLLKIFLIEKKKKQHVLCTLITQLPVEALATLFRNAILFYCRYVEIRYLDASQSGMTSSQLSANTMLVHLSLAGCGLREVGQLTFPNHTQPGPRPQPADVSARAPVP